MLEFLCSADHLAQVIGSPMVTILVLVWDFCGCFCLALSMLLWLLLHVVVGLSLAIKNPVFKTGGRSDCHSGCVDAK